MSSQFILTLGVARKIEEKICALSGVAHLYGGVHGEYAVYLPGGRVAGLRTPLPQTDLSQNAAGNRFLLEIYPAVDVSALVPLPSLGQQVHDVAKQTLSDAGCVDPVVLVRFAEATGSFGDSLQADESAGDSEGEHV